MKMVHLLAAAWSSLWATGFYMNGRSGWAAVMVTITGLNLAGWRISVAIDKTDERARTRR